MRLLILTYGVASYGVFCGTIVYLLGFLANHGVPKSIDSGIPQGLFLSLLINLGLIALFGLQHSIMARPAFKRKWTKIIPKPAERSTYVLASCLCFILLYIYWQPMPQMLLQVQDPTKRTAAWTLFGFGWLVLLLATFMTNHFDLFGLRQVVCNFRQTKTHPIQFRTIGFYRYVRHPIMTGFLIVVWATPDLTLGHLLFASLMTLYIFIGIQHEEKDLREELGDVYERYASEVPSVFPVPGRRAGRAPVIRSLDDLV